MEIRPPSTHTKIYIFMYSLEYETCYIANTVVVVNVMTIVYKSRYQTQMHDNIYCMTIFNKRNCGKAILFHCYKLDHQKIYFFFAYEI